MLKTKLFLSTMEFILPTLLIEREIIGIPANAFVIGTVGRISEQKAPDIFIQSARRIKDQVSDAWFIIVGDGELRSQIEKQAIEYHLADSLIVTGWVADAIPFIGLFDVAVLLSRWEGFGLALIEYMAAGKPIVATNVDAIPELIEDNKNGLLVEMNDPAAVCNAVLKIKNNPELRKKYIHEGFRIAQERFTIERVVEEHQKLFDVLTQNDVRRVSCSSNR